MQLEDDVAPDRFFFFYIKSDNQWETTLFNLYVKLKSDWRLITSLVLNYAGIDKRTPTDANLRLNQISSVRQSASLQIIRFFFTSGLTFPSQYT